MGFAMSARGFIGSGWQLIHWGSWAVFGWREISHGAAIGMVVDKQNVIR
jgi:hypothetical protein